MCPRIARIKRIKQQAEGGIASCPVLVLAVIRLIRAIRGHLFYAHMPVHRGGRFWRNAPMPSWASALQAFAVITSTATP